MDGWTQVRDYSVWASEDHVAFVEVWKHINGWYTVNANDGTPSDLKPYKTRSESYAFQHALSLSREYVDRAEDECACGEDDDCANPVTNPYGEVHGVRLNVWSFEDDRKLEPYEL